MNTQVLLSLAVLYLQSVCGSVHHGPLALPVVLHSGYLADTPEVAAAKSAHLATLSQHSVSHGYSGSLLGGVHVLHGDSRYHGPTAVPHVLHDGHIADTHEVAAAKAEHFAAVAKAQAHGHGGYSSVGHVHAGAYDHHVTAYHGPTAVPHVLHDGHIADTDEVAAAKAEHFAAVAKTQAHGHGGYSSVGHAHAGAYDHHVTAYHGPLAKPVVLPSGFLADTHDVAAAKQHHLHLLHSSHGAHHSHY